MISVHEWIQPTKEKTKKPNLEWGTTSATELEAKEELKPSRKIPNTTQICRGCCATIHSGNNMISVHEWIQPTQESTRKPNWEWMIITFAMEPWADQDLRWSRKSKKTIHFAVVIAQRWTMATT